jgi:hypothetical protein|tara:strand:+ start:315 stop:752 length:438 start_codon:yes stop_codon:yes gene_type:complete
MKIVIINLLRLFIVTYFLGCVNNDDPKFEELVDGLFITRTITNYKTYGKRDGALTQGFIIFQLENNESIQLELEVTYNPIPILTSGYWKTLENESIRGKVQTISLKFLGGQGEGPSLGGSFDLKYKSETRFKVFIPLRPINKPKW